MNGNQASQEFENEAALSKKSMLEEAKRSLGAQGEKSDAGAMVVRKATASDIDRHTGEGSAPQPMVQSLHQERLEERREIYEGASTLQVTKEESDQLLAAVDKDDINIRPDGLIYMPQAFYREKLNRVFGIGQWALVQNVPMGVQNDVAFFDGSLYIRGKFVARAMGEAVYYGTGSQSWATVYESAKSDCLVRCCKDLSISHELWEPRFIELWIKEYAVKVWRTKTKNRQTGSLGVFQWRRKNAEPFYDEERKFSDSSVSEATPAVASHAPEKQKADTRPASETPRKAEAVDKDYSSKSYEQLKSVLVPFGKYSKDKPFSEVSSTNLEKAIGWAVTNAKDRYKQFILDATKYLLCFEIESSIENAKDAAELMNITEEMAQVQANTHQLDHPTYLYLQAKIKAKEAKGFSGGELPVE